MSRTVRNDTYVHYKGFTIQKLADNKYYCPSATLGRTYKRLAGVKKAIDRTIKREPNLAKKY